MTLPLWAYASSVWNLVLVHVSRLGWTPWKRSCNSENQRNRATRRRKELRTHAVARVKAISTTRVRMFDRKSFTGQFDPFALYITDNQELKAIEISTSMANTSS